MADTLFKPFNDIQLRAFRCDNSGKTFEYGTDILDDKVTEALFALEENETMADVEVEIQVPIEPEPKEPETDEDIVEQQYEDVLPEIEENAAEEEYISDNDDKEIIETAYETQTVIVHKPVLIEGYDVILLEKKKLEKIEQLNRNCNQKRYGQTFLATLQDKVCEFDTTEQTQIDLQTAAIVTASGLTYNDWVTNNGVVIDLTDEDVQVVFRSFYSLVSPLYTRVLELTGEINNAKDLEELEAIDIDL